MIPLLESLNRTTSIINTPDGRDTEDLWIYHRIFTVNSYEENSSGSVAIEAPIFCTFVINSCLIFVSFKLNHNL